MTCSDRSSESTSAQPLAQQPQNSHQRVQDTRQIRGRSTMTTENAHPQCGCVQMSYCLSGTIYVGPHSFYSSFVKFPLILFFLIFLVVLALCHNFSCFLFTLFFVMCCSR
ncbi:hypothetical protein BDV32DRAFT_104445 [Aspergillus pseudonomiae]|nr:hypothetical protein BDV32DRAFT_104445 [Aspergillus pseudonomiae]